MCQSSFTDSVPQNGLYEEVCGIPGQAPRQQPSHKHGQQQETEPVIHHNQAYENTHFTDPIHGSTPVAAAQGMYESLAAHADHTYTELSKA